MNQSLLFDAAPEIKPDVPGYPCVISPCGQYRYVVYRVCNPVEKPRLLLWVCLNPSKADASVTDPSLTRMINFAKAWGYDGICVVNLFAYRATEPADMKAARDPVGDDADYWICQCAGHCEFAIAGWGTNGSFLKRDEQVRVLFAAMKMPLHVLKLNEDGSPLHPLFAPGSLQPIPWEREPVIGKDD